MTGAERIKAYRQRKKENNPNWSKEENTKRNQRKKAFEATLSPTQKAERNKMNKARVAKHREQKKREGKVIECFASYNKLLFQQLYCSYSACICLNALL